MATFLSLAICHLVGLRGSVWLERGRYEEAEGKYGQAVAHDRAGRTNVSVAQLCCAAYLELCVCSGQGFTPVPLDRGYNEHDPAVSVGQDAGSPSHLCSH